MNHFNDTHLFKQMNLGINPAALLPGAAPPVKEPEVVAVGFDTPAQVNTLQSANKVSVSPPLTALDVPNEFEFRLPFDRPHDL